MSRVGEHDFVCSSAFQAGSLEVRFGINPLKARLKAELQTKSPLEDEENRAWTTKEPSHSRN